MSEQLFTSSLLLRHCVRAPGLENPLPNVSADPNDFSSLPWPSFPAKPDHCVPLGIELLERQAISLAESLPPGRVRIVSDVFNRTIVTAKALCRGLQCSSQTIDAALFDPTGAGVCRPVAEDVAAAAMRVRYAEALPLGDEYWRLVDQLQSVLGAPNVSAHGAWLRDLPTAVTSKGKLQGGMYVAATLVENLLLESGAGLEVGWGNTDVAKVLQLLAVHQRYFFIAHGPRVVARNKVSNIIAHVAQALQNSSAGVDGSGSVILVGHDTSIANVAELLNTTWAAGQYGYGTIPGSGLRFDLVARCNNSSATNATIRLIPCRNAELFVRVTYTWASVVQPGADGAMQSVPVVFKDAVGAVEPGLLPLEVWDKLVANIVDPKCVTKSNL